MSNVSNPGSPPSPEDTDPDGSKLPESVRWFIDKYSVKFVELAPQPTPAPDPVDPGSPPVEPGSTMSGYYESGHYTDDRLKNLRIRVDSMDSSASKLKIGFSTDLVYRSQVEAELQGSFQGVPGTRGLIDQTEEVISQDGETVVGASIGLQIPSLEEILAELPGTRGEDPVVALDLYFVVDPPLPGRHKHAFTINFPETQITSVVFRLSRHGGNLSASAAGLEQSGEVELDNSIKYQGTGSGRWDVSISNNAEGNAAYAIAGRFTVGLDNAAKAVIDALFLREDLL